ncbi:MAG: hypothetical protein II569_04360 [Paludibacteraceae bacterium]|nr:hypothetical protein [Paludibacteraceae bacterium]
MPVFTAHADEINTGNSFFTSIVSSFLDVFDSDEGIRYSSESPSLPSESFGGDYVVEESSGGDFGSGSPIFVSDYSSSLVGATYNYSEVFGDDYDLYEDAVSPYSIVWNGQSFFNGDQIMYAGQTLTASNTAKYRDEHGTVHDLEVPSGLLVLVDQYGFIFSQNGGTSSEYVRMPLSGGEWFLVILAAAYAAYLVYRKRAAQKDDTKAAVQS